MICFSSEFLVAFIVLTPQLQVIVSSRSPTPSIVKVIVVNTIIIAFIHSKSIVDAVTPTFIAQLATKIIIEFLLDVPGKHRYSS